MDLVADGMASRAITFAMIAEWWTWKGRKSRESSELGDLQKDLIKNDLRYWTDRRLFES